MADDHREDAPHPRAAGGAASTGRSRRSGATAPAAPAPRIRRERPRPRRSRSRFAPLLRVYRRPLANRGSVRRSAGGCGVASLTHEAGGRSHDAGRRGARAARRAAPPARAGRVRAPRLRAVPGVVARSRHCRHEAVPLPRSRPPALAGRVPLGLAHRVRHRLPPDHRLPVPDGAVLLAHRPRRDARVGRATPVARVDLARRRPRRPVAVPHARRRARRARSRARSSTCSRPTSSRSRPGSRCCSWRGPGCRGWSGWRCGRCAGAAGAIRPCSRW